MKYALILCLIITVMGVGGMASGCPGSYAASAHAQPIPCQPGFTTPAASLVAFPLRFNDALPAFFGALIPFALLTFVLIFAHAPASRQAIPRLHTPPPRFI